MYQLFRDRPLVILCIIVVNALLSLWCIYSDPVINNDAVTYLMTARQIIDGHWADAVNYYNWPFYSIFVASTAKLFFIDVEAAAYILNTIFATSMTLAFVCIVAELSNNNRRIILIAMVVILFFPSINKYRSFIIRDFGYLSFYLWSLYFIFRFCGTLYKKHLIGWLVCAAISCLFRFEGIAFMFIAPFFLLLFVADKLPHRRTIITSLSAIIAVSCLALLFWYVDNKYDTIIADAKNTGHDINGISDLFLANIQQRLNGQELTPLTYLGVLSANIGDVMYELIRRMAVFYFLFVIYAYIKRLTLDGNLIRKIWLVYVVTNIVVLIGFSHFNNFLVSRYTLATTLTLLLIAPFAIDYLYEKARVAGKLGKTTAILTALILTVISIERLIIENNKTYIKESGEWLAENIPADAELYSNNKLVIYYADRSADATMNRIYSFYSLINLLVTNNIRFYDYIALVIDKTDPGHDEARQTLTYNFGFPIKTFKQDDNNSILIFQYERPTPKTIEAK